MQEISPIKQRIMQVLDLKGVSRYEFYKKSGMTRGVLDKKSGISEDNIAKFIAYCPKINIEWLLTGKGEKFKREEGEPAVADPKDQYIIELQKEQIQRLKEEVKELKKAQESRTNYNKAAEPDP